MQKKTEEWMNEKSVLVKQLEDMNARNNEETNQNNANILKLKAQDEQMRLQHTHSEKVVKECEGKYSTIYRLCIIFLDPLVG